MCELCNLTSIYEPERKKAIDEVEHIMAMCDQVKGYYSEILHGSRKPHTNDMKSVELAEKHLIRLLIDDVL